MTDEEKAKAIERLKILTGNNDEKLIGVLIDEAEAFVLGYTNRTRLVTGLEKAVRDLAVIALNRLGTEGETGRSEGGESYSFDNAPRQIYDVLNRFRLARVGCRTYETKTKQTGVLLSQKTDGKKGQRGQHLRRVQCC